MNLLKFEFNEYILFYEYPYTLFAKRESIKPAHNSSRGSDIIFKSAIFDFAQISLVTCRLFLLEQRIYKHAPYANKLASAKPCICIS